MSAPSVPQITLEQAKQLVTFLEQGEQEKADKLRYTDGKQLILLYTCV